MVQYDVKCPKCGHTWNVMHGTVDGVTSMSRECPECHTSFTAPIPALSAEPVVAAEEPKGE